jgi:hypothetical protein
MGSIPFGTTSDIECVMNITLQKASGRAMCRHPRCEGKNDYIKDGRIIKNTTCALIYFDSASGGGTAYYCRGCIDKIHDEIRRVLNPKLWAFA